MVHTCTNVHLVDSLVIQGKCATSSALQVIAYTDLVRRALPTLLNDGGDMLDIERIATPGQVQMLYNIRLNIQLANPSTGGPLRSAVRMLQRMRRHHRVRHLVLADLERRAGYQPLVYAMEQAMQTHGIDSLMPVSSHTSPVTIRRSSQLPHAQCSCQSNSRPEELLYCRNFLNMSMMHGLSVSVMPGI